MLRSIVRRSVQPLLLAALVAVGSRASAAPPTTAKTKGRGKVVRVERPRASMAPPQFCVIMDGADKLLCIGEPKAGETVSFLDQGTGEMLGTLKVTSAVPTTRMTACAGSSTTLWDATGELSSGTMDTISQSSKNVALRGITLGHTAKAMPNYTAPPELADQQLLVAVDFEGDGRADLTMYNYSCNTDGTPGSNGPRGNGDVQCFDTYTQYGGKLARTHQDILELCY